MRTTIEQVPFVVPYASTAEMAEQVWVATKSFAREQTRFQFSDRRVQAVGYRHNGKYLEAVVGQNDPLEHETVLVILESPQCFVVCTENRGVRRGMPILIGKPEWTIDFL